VGQTSFLQAHQHGLAIGSNFYLLEINHKHKIHGKGNWNMNLDEKYWETRCEFWCANYLELAQAVGKLIIYADRVDDYGELKYEVERVKKLLIKDAYGPGKQ
jgi:hypothetical protein